MTPASAYGQTGGITPRASQGMVFDAHIRGFAFLGGACTRCIYDNMAMAVDAVFTGRERQYNRRFLQLCSHCLIEPTALLDRLTHHCDIVETGNDSWRFKNRV